MERAKAKHKHTKTPSKALGRGSNTRPKARISRPQNGPRRGGAQNDTQGKGVNVRGGVSKKKKVGRREKFVRKFLPVNNDVPKDDEELRLEAELFGADVVSSHHQQQQSIDDDDDLLKRLQGEDEGSDQGDDSDGAGADVEKGKHKQNDDSAWHDEDDEKVHIDLNAHNQLKKLKFSATSTRVSATVLHSQLRKQHEKLSRATTAWTQKSNKSKQSDSDSESENDLDAIDQVLKSTEPLTTRARAGPLPQTIIEVQRHLNANIHGPSKGAIHNIGFHPTANILFTAGQDKHVRIFRVDNNTNEMIHDTNLRDLSILCAKFSAQAQTIVAAGRGQVFYTIDLERGSIVRHNSFASKLNKHVELFACHPQTQQLAFVGKSNSIVFTHPSTQRELFTVGARSEISDMTFLPDGNRLLTVGKEGAMHIFDLRTQRCERISRDQASLHSTTVALFESQLIATGNSAGVVNVYETDSVLNNDNPTPIKSLLNLTTRVTSLAFHPQGQILALASHATKQAIKMAHIPSYHVFRNWPTDKTPTKKACSISFSAKGGLMAVGNNQGKVLVYRLKHYPQA